MGKNSAYETAEITCLSLGNFPLCAMSSLNDNVDFRPLYRNLFKAELLSRCSG